MLTSMDFALGGGVQPYREILDVPSDTGVLTRDVGFRPRILIIEQEFGGSSWMQMSYNADINPNNIAQTYYYNSGSNKVVTIYDMTVATQGTNMILEVNDTGFKFRLGDTSPTGQFNGRYHITCLPFGSVLGGTEITTITGNPQKARSFTAVVGHRYIVAYGSFTVTTGITEETSISGLDVIASGGKVDTTPYATSNYATLDIVIGIATSTTVTCSWRNADTAQYALISWIDLDAQ